jgi:biopolymer transport protein ExbD
MKKRKSSDRNFDTKMDLTPMIDCVFLLIMFFILTTQITVNIEEVTLPFALEGKPEKRNNTDTVMLIMNVRQSQSPEAAARAGEIVYRGKVLNTKTLRAMLDEEVAYDAALPPRGRGRAKEVGPNNVQLSQLEILIRYDKHVKSEYLRNIFEQCQKAGVYKLKLATTQP